MDAVKLIKDDHKQVKELFRQFENARSADRKRMIADVKNATVVIANPEHFAIALKYETDKHAAPLVVAKGVDSVALAIRKMAESCSVPVIENRPLARAMFDKVTIGDTIPAIFYRAIAEIIVMLNKRKSRQFG